ncbi:unnamed protein product [Sphagnum tenellum]
MGQPNKPVTGSPALKRLLNESEAAAEYGDGSMLHLMAKALFENSTSTRTYAIPVSQNALEPATWKITLSPNRGVKNIPASVAIMGQDIGFIIPENLANQSPLDVLCQRIKADQSLPVEAKLDREKDTGKGPITSLTLTAKAKGLPAKSLSILPSSDLINVTSTDGSGTMDLSEVKKTIYNKQFHLIVCPYYNDATVAAMAPDLEERFSIKRQIEGQMITAVSGTMDEIKTQCSSKHITALALGTGSPTPHYVWAAALCGVIAESAQIDPARPFNTLPLRGCIPPPDEQRLERAQRAAFLDAGYSTYNVGFGGEPSIERLITMYKNDRAPADESYLSLNTLLTLSFLRRSGTIHLKINGTLYSAKGGFKYNLGVPKNEAILDASGQAIGYKSLPQVAYFEGEIYDSRDIDLKLLCSLDDGTATLELANGKTIILRNCWYAGTGEGQTEEGTIVFRLEGRSAEESK